MAKKLWNFPHYMEAALLYTADFMCFGSSNHKLTTSELNNLRVKLSIEERHIQEVPFKEMVGLIKGARGYSKPEEEASKTKFLETAGRKYEKLLNFQDEHTKQRMVMLMDKSGNCGERADYVVWLLKEWQVEGVTKFTDARSDHAYVVISDHSSAEVEDRCRRISFENSNPIQTPFQKDTFIMDPWIRSDTQRIDKNKAYSILKTGTWLNAKYDNAITVWRRAVSNALTGGL